MLGKEWAEVEKLVKKGGEKFGAGYGAAFKKVAGVPEARTLKEKVEAFKKSDKASTLAKNLETMKASWKKTSKWSDLPNGMEHVDPNKELDKMDIKKLEGEVGKNLK